MFAVSLKKSYIGWIVLLMSMISVLAIWAPTDAKAQDTKDLCTGANLTFDSSGSNTSCNTDSNGNPCTGNSANCNAESGINDLIATVINIFSVIVGIAAVVMIIYGGFRYITSGGDSGNLTTAKNIILYAIVGLIIVAFAQFIVKFVLAKIA